MNDKLQDNIEIERKYPLNADNKAKLLNRLIEIDFQLELKGTYLETNVLYKHSLLESKSGEVLRLRKMININPGSMFYGKTKYLLTFKKRFDDGGGFKKAIEYETEVNDKMGLILESLGYVPILVYEKRRETYELDNGCELALDELSFGNYFELEGTEEQIVEAEALLNINYPCETRSYPELTKEFGVESNDYGYTSIRALLNS